MTSEPSKFSEDANTSYAEACTSRFIYNLTILTVVPGLSEELPTSPPEPEYPLPGFYQRYMDRCKTFLENKLIWEKSVNEDGTLSTWAEERIQHLPAALFTRDIILDAISEMRAGIGYKNYSNLTPEKTQALIHAFLDAYDLNPVVTDNAQGHS